MQGRGKQEIPEKAHRPDMREFGTVNLLSFHQGEPGSITGRITPRFPHVGIVPDDAVGRRVFPGISCLPWPFNSGAAPYSPQSPSLALKTSLLGAAQISSLTHLSMSFGTTGRSDEALGVRVSVARIAPSLLDLGTRSYIIPLTTAVSNGLGGRWAGGLHNSQADGARYQGISEVPNEMGTVKSSCISLRAERKFPSPDRKEHIAQRSGRPARPGVVPVVSLSFIVTYTGRSQAIPSTGTNILRVMNHVASHPGEPRSIPGGVSPGFSQVGIVPDDTARRRVSSGISRFPLALSARRCSIPTSLPPSSALKTSVLRAAQISSLTHESTARQSRALLALSVDEALTERGKVALTAPALLGLK
ncbi:hypothetical protein PR048_033280 [Dryococelus australis]|uniref:Uncharacterized protein n=1 Tax=Dryococelus australis TaxID=614101 RepID=A0ABQ9FZU3_9NEOP|nr:hypothetical protein PR048_033280 [Dryococelus australis]